MPRPHVPATAGASLPDTPLTRLLAATATAALLTAVAAPVRRLGRRDARDSFPFSHYPMFSATRKDHCWVTHLLGERSDGTITPLHYSYLGTGGLNAVRRQVRRRVKDGEGQQIADRAAERLARRNRREDRTVARLHVVRGRYLVESFMRGAPEAQYTSRLDVRGTAVVPGRDDLAAALPDQQVISR